MPGFDGTGPLGRGAMTGGGRGYCMIPLERGAYGMGFGRGLGCRGFGRMYQTYTPAISEKEILINQVEYLKDQLQQLQKRLEELAGDSD